MPVKLCAVCCVLWIHGAVASPSRADLQPLIRSSHEGVTSVKDVVGLSTFELDIVFNWGPKHGQSVLGSQSLRVA